MIKKLSITICILLHALSIESMQDQLYLNKIQKYFLGNKPATEFYQKKTQEFLNYLNIQESVPIYQWKPHRLISSLFNGDTVLGFTSITGIWLNETYLNNSPADQLFIIAHEVAHYALKHPRTILLKATVCSLTAIISLYMTYLINMPSQFNESKSIVRSLALLAAKYSMCGFFINRFLFLHGINKPTIKLEKDADLKALDILWNTGHSQAILDYISSVKNLMSCGRGNWNDGWHPTIAQEYEYLSAHHGSLSPRPPFTD